MLGREAVALIAVIVVAGVLGAATSQRYDVSLLATQVPLPHSIERVEPPTIPASIDGFVLGMTLREINQVRVGRGHVDPLRVTPRRWRGFSTGYTLRPVVPNADDLSDYATTLDAEKRLSSCAGRTLVVEQCERRASLSRGDSLTRVQEILGQGAWMFKGCGNAASGLPEIEWQLSRHLYVRALILDEKVVLFVLSTQKKQQPMGL